MLNLLISIATIFIGTLVALYGAYGDYRSIKRSQRVEVVDRALSRQLSYVYSVRDDIGRVPDAATLSSAMFSRENVADVQFSYVKTASYGYVCAAAPATEVNVEAFKKVSDAYDGSFYGSSCNSSGGPANGVVAITVRIN